jgi:hypothetical protein
MAFLKKQTVSHALSLEDCPLYNVLHLSLIYYDALYYPHLNQNVFDMPDSFCNWLCAALESHLCCGTCYRLKRDIQVNFSMHRFVVTSGSDTVSFSVVDIESPSFTVCHVLHHFAFFNTGLTKLNLHFLNQNPSWCYRADADFVCALVELPRSDLLQAAHHFLADHPISKLWKDDLVRLIVHDFLHECLELLSHSNTDVLATVLNTVCGH